MIGIMIGKTDLPENVFHSRALGMIKNSYVLQFENPLEWALWCRDVAKAGLNEDIETLNHLAKKLKL